MEDASHSLTYWEPLLLLVGAVIGATLFKRLGLGTILGYLLAGVAIGPVARLISDGEELLHVAELGVVLLLFIIGLELNPSRLWAMRRSIFGLGFAQVFLSGAVIALLAAVGLGLSFQSSMIIGFGLGAVLNSRCSPVDGRTRRVEPAIWPDRILHPALPGYFHCTTACPCSAAFARW